MGDTERHTVVRFGLTSVVYVIAKYLILQCMGQNLQSEVL